MKNQKELNKFWWEDRNADIGRWYLMFDDTEFLSLHDVDVVYRSSYPWQKPNCKYLLNMCQFGYSCSEALQVDTIEEAKKACEKWLVQHLTDRIDSLQSSIRYCKRLLQLIED
jgi:hypothetical protein